MAAALWRSGDVAVWLGHLQKYEQRIDALQKDGLGELDGWYRSLPETIAKRKDAYITADEIVRIVVKLRAEQVQWKLKRGKWRPRLLDFARAHSDDTVRSATTVAFRLAASGSAKDVSVALAPLTKLKGIGSATASAVLAAVQPAYPFMSDEAMAAAVQGPLKYTVPEYVQLVEVLQSKATELNASGGNTWTASDIERSLYSSAAAGKVPKAAKKTKADSTASKPAAKAKSPGKQSMGKTDGAAGGGKKQKR